MNVDSLIYKMQLIYRHYKWYLHDWLICQYCLYAVLVESYLCVMCALHHLHVSINSSQMEIGALFLTLDIIKLHQKYI